MTKQILTVLFMTAILATGAAATSTIIIGDADATKSKGTPAWSYGKANQKIVCGDRLCSEIPGGYESWKESQSSSSEKRSSGESSKSSAYSSTKKAMNQDRMSSHDHSWKSVSGTMTSSQDPGLGHESHQLAIILPPSDTMYKGVITYDASESIQLVALHGPLAEGEDKGQKIWTTDGETKFALTLVDRDDSMGSWKFAANALAVHTPTPEPFTVSYSVSYMEKDASDTVITGTMTSSQDPGLGHESHQLAIILPPSDMTYSGVLTYSASESIQLVALHGPLAEGEDKGQKIWTTDGETKFALTLVDRDDSMGSWMFAANALAVHTPTPEPFTVSYSVAAGKN